MNRAFPGGISAMAPAIGRTEDALDNRIYERKSQCMTVNDAMAMQKTSDTTYFAEAVAAKSGGTFVKLPEIGKVSNEDLLKKFNQLHSSLGRLNSEFAAAIDSDDQIDAKERRTLTDIGNDIHRTTQELLAIAFMVYGVSA